TSHPHPAAMHRPAKQVRLLTVVSQSLAERATRPPATRRLDRSRRGAARPRPGSARGICPARRRAAFPTPAPYRTRERSTGSSRRVRCLVRPILRASVRRHRSDLVRSTRRALTGRFLDLTTSPWRWGRLKGMPRIAAPESETLPEEWRRLNRSPPPRGRGCPHPVASDKGMARLRFRLFLYASHPRLGNGSAWATPGRGPT